MRISPNSTNEMLLALAQASEREQGAIERLASGRRVNSPSDDPASMALAIENQARATQTDEFLFSVQSLRALLSTADSTINSVVINLERAVALGVQGANGTQAQSQRDAIAQEVRGIRDRVLSLANVSFRGSYVFAGTASSAPPFVAADQDQAGVHYAGNSGVNRIAIGEGGMSIATNMPGDQLFSAPGSDVFAALDELVNALENGTNSEVSDAASHARKALDHVSAKRVFFGNALKQLENDEFTLKRSQLDIASEMKTLIAADPAQTISELVDARTARETLLTAMGKAGKNSLLDYLP